MKNLRFKLREHFEDPANSARIPGGTIVYSSGEVVKEYIENVEHAYRTVTRHNPNGDSMLYSKIFHNVPIGILEALESN